MAASTNLGFLVLSWVLMVTGGLLIALRILWEIVRHPLTVFKKSPRDVPPACLIDPSLGTHEYVTANGIKFHCVCAGDKSKPLMLFLHGFPEFWFSWRHQMREFSKDYRVVAIDMRGYGGSERPPNKLDYTMSKLKQDIVELVPALGYSKCTLVAHDWGGSIAWRVVIGHPELIEKLIVINCPHPKVFAKQMAKGWGQLFRSWYFFMFQVPKLPELIISMSDFNAFDSMFAGMKSKSSFPPEVSEAYKYAFSKPGAVTAPLNYYRCMFVRDNSAGRTSLSKMIDVPTLLIWGDQDVVFEKDMADRHDTVVTNLTVRHFPECSHWSQQEDPDSVNQVMREFLQE